MSTMRCSGSVHRLGYLLLPVSRRVVARNVSAHHLQPRFQKVPCAKHSVFDKLSCALKNAQDARRASHKVAAASFVTDAPLQKRRRLRHILVPADNSDLFVKLQSELEGGADFAQLAKEHSSCPSAGRGGALGWVKQGMGLPPQLEEAVFDADVGGITTGETPGGLHIFQILDEQEAAEVQMMTVDELETMLKEQPEGVQYIDVREQQEHDIASLPQFKLLPLSKFGEWGPTLAEDFDTDKPVVCMCHAGVRSMQVANLMVDQGFTKVFNVSGGIEAWSCFIDPSVPRY